MNLNRRAVVLLSAAGAAAMVLAWMFGLPELAALAFAGWCSLMASALWLVRRGQPPLLWASVEPSAVTRGELARLHLRFSHPPGNNAPSGAARVHGRLGSAGEGILAITPQRPNDHTDLSIELPTPDRGLVTIGPLAATMTDPLGWWRSEHSLEVSATLVVRPKVHRIGNVPGAGGRRPSPGRRTGAAPIASGSDEDLVGLRPYVRGDDLRRIHWRTSARRNELHVVQVEPPVQSPSVTVVLDQGVDASADGFERAVEAAASVLTAAAMAGRSLRLVGSIPAATAVNLTGRSALPGVSNGELADSGLVEPNAAADLLDALATVVRHRGSDLSATMGSLDVEQSTIVLCSASITSVSGGAAGPVDILVACGDTPPTPMSKAHTIVAWDGTASLDSAWSNTADSPAQVGFR